MCFIPCFGSYLCCPFFNYLFEVSECSIIFTSAGDAQGWLHTLHQISVLHQNSLSLINQILLSSQKLMALSLQDCDIFLNLLDSRNQLHRVSVVGVNLLKLLFETMVNHREIVIGLCEKAQKPICCLVVLVPHFGFTMQC